MNTPRYSVFLAAGLAAVVVSLQAEEFSNAQSWGPGSGWTWTNNNGGEDPAEAGDDDITKSTPNHRGHIRFTVLGFPNLIDDQTINGVNNAPRLTRSAFAAPYANLPANTGWLIETAVHKYVENDDEIFDGTFDPQTPGIRAHCGLLLWKDHNNWILWGPHMWNSMRAQGVIGGAWHGSLQDVTPTTQPHDYMRIVKRVVDSTHPRYYFYYSNNKYDWRCAGFFDDENEIFSGTDFEYGLMAKSWGDDYRVQFPYFYECAPLNDLEEFYGTTLDPIWSTSGSTVSVQGGHLRLDVPAGADFWYQDEDGPAALRTPKFDSWVIDTKIKEQPVGGGTSAYGIMIYRNNDNWLHLGLFPAAGTSGATIVTGILGGTNLYTNLRNKAGLYSRLRVRKDGSTNMYTFQCSNDDGLVWHDVGTPWVDTGNALAGARYGLMAKSYGAGGGAYVVDFDFFRECTFPNGTTKAVIEANTVA